jgi:hypothetical protein
MGQHIIPFIGLGGDLLLTGHTIIGITLTIILTISIEITERICLLTVRILEVDIWLEINLFRGIIFNEITILLEGTGAFIKEIIMEAGRIIGGIMVGRM